MNLSCDGVIALYTLYVRQDVAKGWLESQPRTKIETDTPGYLHAKSLSFLFGFPDSVGVSLRAPLALLADRNMSIFLLPGGWSVGAVDTVDATRREALVCRDASRVTGSLARRFHEKAHATKLPSTA